MKHIHRFHDEQSIEMALSITPKKNQTDILALGKEGLFCVDDLTGSALYALPIVVPPQLKGPQPRLSLQYDSNKTGGLAGFGWELKGIPEITRIGESFYADGQRVSPEQQADGGLIWYKGNGSHVQFTAMWQGGQKRWLASWAEDVFGNFISFRYMADKPVLITYGLAGDKLVRRVELDYDRDGHLENIKTYLGDNPVRTYRLVRVDEYVTEIHLLAHRPDGKTHGLNAPVQFLWSDIENGDQSKARIVAFREPCGLVTKVEYAASASGHVVDSYSVKFRDLQGMSEYRVNRWFGGGRQDSVHGWIFHETREWDAAAKSGRFVVFGDGPELSHLVKRGGTFAAAANITEGDHTIAFVHGSAKPLFHYKTTETTFEYEFLGNPRLKKQEIVQYADKGVPLFTRQQRFFYNKQGKAVRIQSDDLTEFLDYQLVQGRIGSRNHEILLASGRSIYEGNLEVAVEANLLKRTEIIYEFDNPSRPLAPTAQYQKHWIGAKGGMTATETVFLDHAGHPKGHKNTLGVVSKIECDAYHFPHKVTHASADGQVRCEEFETDPRFGQLVAARDHKGMASRMVYDAFGGLVEEWGIDPSQPKSWGDRSKLVRLSRRSSRRDAGAGLTMLETVTGDQNKPGSVRQYIDAFGRVLKSEKKLGKSAWQVELVDYESLDRIKRRSLPYLESSKNPDSPCPLWVTMLGDDYGRDVGQDMPDGRRIGKNYLTDAEAGTLEIQSFTAAPDGGDKFVAAEIYNQKGMIARRRETDSGLTYYSRDALGRIIRQVDPCGVETSYQYDGLDRCIFEKNSIRGNRRYHFDKSGLLVRADMNGEVISYNYDGFGRITKKVVAAGKGGILPPQIYEIAYLTKPGSGTEHIRETMPGGYQYEITFAPHGAELERKVILGNGVSFTLSSEFTSNAALAARTYPNGVKIRNEYSNGDQLKRVIWAAKPPKNWGSLTDSIVEYEGHDCYGRPELTHFHNRVSEVRRYNEFGQTTKLAIGLRAGGREAYLHQEYTYTSGMDGLLSGIEDKRDGNAATLQSFGYDEFDRLQKSSLSGREFGVEDEVFSYGKAGNVTGFTNSAGSCDFAGVNPYQVNLAGNSGLAQAFDENGNLVTKEGSGKRSRYQFDADNRLLQSSISEGGVEAATEYVYDFDGGRFLKVDPDGVRSFYLAPDYQITVYPDGRILGTIKVQGANGTVATVTEPIESIRNFPKSDLVKNNDPASVVAGNGRYEAGVLFLHKNNLGSILLATDDKGDRKASIGWTVWGAVDESATSSVCNFELQFAGMVYDTGTGLHYAGDRYYDPESLRFLSPDRVRASTDPYSYTSGDPINYIDYNGMVRWWERVANWWNSPKTAQTGSRFQRVATVVVNAFATVTVLSNYYDHDSLTAEGLVPFVLFMGAFSITFQTLNYVVYGNHENSCLAPVWQRICCGKPFVTANQAILGLAAGTVVSTILFPVSMLTYNGLLAERYDYNTSLYANSTVSAMAIGISVPRGMLAGFMAGLPGLALMNPGLPFLAIAQSSVVGSVAMELLIYELAFVAFSGGDILVQILLSSGTFSAVSQFATTSKILIIAPLVASQNPLIAMLPISNIPFLTTGPLMLANNTRAPFFPRLCCRPCEQDDDEQDNEMDDVRIEEIRDIEEGPGQQNGENQ